MKKTYDRHTMHATRGCGCLYDQISIPFAYVCACVSPCIKNLLSYRTIYLDTDVLFLNGSVVVLELENPKDSLRVSIPLACAKCSVRAWDSSATVVSVVWFSVFAAT